MTNKLRHSGYDAPSQEATQIHNEKAELKEMIEEVLRATPTATWKTTTETRKILTVNLPHDCFIEGVVDLENKTARIDYFITQNLSGAGIGRKLLMSFVAEIKAGGVQTIEGGHIISKDGLHARLKILGEDNSTIFLHSTDTTGPTVKPTRCSLQEAELEIDKKENKKPHKRVEVRTDLTNIDTTGWERPVTN